LRSWHATKNSKDSEALAWVNDGSLSTSLLDRFKIKFERKEHLLYFIECCIFIVFFLAIFLRLYVENCCSVYRPNEVREIPVPEEDEENPKDKEE
jgi:hypothetical protein